MWHIFDTKTIGSKNMKCMHTTVQKLEMIISLSLYHYEPEIVAGCTSVLPLINIRGQSCLYFYFLSIYSRSVK